MLGKYTYVHASARPDVSTKCCGSKEEGKRLVLAGEEVKV